MWTKIKLILIALGVGILAFFKIRGDHYINKYNKVKQDLKEGELKASEGQARADTEAFKEGLQREAEDVKNADAGKRDHFNNDF